MVNFYTGTALSNLTPASMANLTQNTRLFRVVSPFQLYYINPFTNRESLVYKATPGDVLKGKYNYTRGGGGSLTLLIQPQGGSVFYVYDMQLSVVNFYLKPAPQRTFDGSSCYDNMDFFAPPGF